MGPSYRINTASPGWIAPCKTAAIASSSQSNGRARKTPQCISAGTAECFTTDIAASAGVTIHRAGNRLYWGQTTGAGANTVHSVKTDLTDHQSYPAQYGVVGFASNANGVFWMTNGAPVDSGVTTGLMKLTTSGGTPTFVDALLGIPLLMTGDDAHLFLSTQSGFTYYLSRTDGQGQNTGSFSGGLYDQLVDVGGYVYRLTTTNHATPA